MGARKGNGRHMLMAMMLHAANAPIPGDQPRDSPPRRSNAVLLQTRLSERTAWTAQIAVADAREAAPGICCVPPRWLQRRVYWLE